MLKWSYESGVNFLLEQLMKHIVKIQSRNKKVIWYTMVDGNVMYCICEDYEIHKSLKLMIVDFGENVSVQECSSEFMLGTIVRPLAKDSNMQGAILDTVMQYMKMLPQIGEDI